MSIGIFFFLIVIIPLFIVTYMVFFMPTWSHTVKGDIGFLEIIMDLHKQKFGKDIMWYEGQNLLKKWKSKNKIDLRESNRFYEKLNKYVRANENK